MAYPEKSKKEEYEGFRVEKKPERPPETAGLRNTKGLSMKGNMG